MLSLTRKTDYALVALALLGQRKRDGQGPISARAIAETFGLPQPLLMNILKELAQAKIVRSTRGAAGGYELAADPSALSILDVVVAIEGPVKLTQCCSDEAPASGQACAVDSSACPARGAVRKLHRRIVTFFEETTLEDIIHEADADQNGEGPCCMSLTVGDASLAGDTTD